MLKNLKENQKSSKVKFHIFSFVAGAFVLGIVCFGVPSLRADVASLLNSQNTQNDQITYTRSGTLQYATFKQLLNAVLISENWASVSTSTGVGTLNYIGS